MTPEEKKILYRTSKEYRIRALERAKANHIKNSASKNYMELVHLRKYKIFIKDSIKGMQIKIGNRKQQLVRMQRHIEELELAWGKERAERKKTDGNKLG